MNIEIFLHLKKQKKIQSKKTLWTFDWSYTLYFPNKRGSRRPKKDFSQKQKINLVNGEITFFFISK